MKPYAIAVDKRKARHELVGLEAPGGKPLKSRKWLMTRGLYLPKVRGVIYSYGRKILAKDDLVKSSKSIRLIWAGGNHFYLHERRKVLPVFYLRIDGGYFPESFLDNIR